MPTRADRNLRPSPTTIASLMYGDALSSFSSCEGEMFLPPAVMMMSFIRSVILRCVPSTHSPTSPVRSHPSSASTARVASGIFQ